MAEFINDLEIKSFRGIRNLKLKDLQQINILTGDNNCGKTSVLEVIDSLYNPANIREWRQILRRDLNRPASMTLSYYEAFADLFDVNTSEKLISYTAHLERRSFDIVIVAEENEIEVSELEYSRLIGLSRVADDEEDESASEQMQLVSFIEISIYINGGERCD